MRIKLADPKLLGSGQFKYDIPQMGFLGYITISSHDDVIAVLIASHGNHQVLNVQGLYLQALTTETGLVLPVIGCYVLQNPHIRYSLILTIDPSKSDGLDLHRDRDIWVNIIAIDSISMMGNYPDDLGTVYSLINSQWISTKLG